MPTTVFETAPFNRSGIPPSWPKPSGSEGILRGATDGFRWLRCGRSAAGGEVLAQLEGCLVGKQARVDLGPVVEGWLGEHIKD